MLSVKYQLRIQDLTLVADYFFQRGWDGGSYQCSINLNFGELLCVGQKC